MLIINGTAQLMQDNKEFTKGTRHEFNLFSRDMPFEQQLDQIEDYFVTRGWDNIEVLSNGVLTSAEEITHSVLQQAYAKAKQDGIALTINNQPIA
jgi:DNA invertase Pin-like site-specific DNA recombinase